MGVLAKSPLTTLARLARDRAGLALPTALFALVVVSLLITGVFVMTDLDARSSRNRERWARAMHVAEAGASHALAVMRENLRNTEYTNLLRGADNSPSGTDNGYLVGYPGLDSTRAIPAGGKTITIGSYSGTYYVQVIDDPADPDADPLNDLNYRVVLKCKGTTPDGAVAEVDAVIGAVPMPAIAVDGSLTINGDPELVGVCGGAHANEIVVVSGNPTTSGRISATDTVTVSGTIEDTTGAPVTPLSNQPPMEIPDLDPMAYCADADYVLQSNGFVRVVATGTLYNANSTAQFGWKKVSNMPVIWDQTGGAPAEGTFCAEGNVVMGNAIGSAADPLDISIIASGSIKISGNPYTQGDHPEGIMFMAAGDIEFGGNPDAMSENYSGLIYAGSQCKINGNPRINGQVVCKDEPNPSGAANYADMNAISGNPEITFNCAGNLLARRRVLYWYPRVGA